MITLTRNQAIALGVIGGLTLLGTGTTMYFTGRSRGLKTNVDKTADKVVKKVTQKFEGAIKTAIDAAIQDNIGDAVELLGSALSPKKDGDDPEKSKKK